jgi:hypothetical protein
MCTGNSIRLLVGPKEQVFRTTMNCTNGANYDSLLT